MKVSRLLLSSVLIVSATLTQTASANGCSSSFYCYGNNNNLPNAPRVVVAAAPSTVTLVSRPAILDSRTTSRPVASTAVRPAPQVRRTTNTRTVCQVRINKLMQQAQNTERQAVIKSKQRQRLQSRNLFKKAASLRAQAQRINCAR